MRFNQHYELKDRHAFMGASKYHWINYTEEKMETAYLNFLAIQKGTTLHEFACTCIKLGQRLEKKKITLNMYVNDAIGYHMTPEQPLYYSENCFGTADAIAYSEKKKFLRIHDLKTGQAPGHFEQLMIYAALFCLEYHVEPKELKGVELRIYQSNEILVLEPELEILEDIKNKIIEFDALIEGIKTGSIIDYE